MKKILIFGIAAFILFYSWKVLAFWPFEKTWSNSPDESRIYVDDNGYAFALDTRAKTVGDFLTEQKISLNDDDYLFPQKDAKLASGLRVIIKRALPITIKVDGQELKVKTFASNVADAISQAGVTLSHLDKVEPEKKSVLEKNLKINITRINVEEVTEIESIDFSTIEKDDPKLKWRQQRIDQEGENGEKEVNYRITYTNGKVSSKLKLSQSVTKKPTPKVVYNGTKIEVGKVTRGGASWYSYTDTLACASLQFPKGTWLRVTNTVTGKQVIVQVNDSGPYSDNKIIDLDKVAFAKIGNLGQGVVNVKVEEILE